ncbi:glycosyl hydrolase [Bacteroides sp. GD17]|jgi:mannan endo-1,4-beta-mannosidase|uniref:glycosyl hydrolase n=1 Tax=Bacteroides sp. GD17 TaxID=3139826 RepID=UPI00313CDE5D
MLKQLLFVLLLLFTSCGDSNEEAPLPEAPKMTTYSLTELASGDVDIVVTYDQRVTLPSGNISKMSVGDAVVTSASVFLQDLTVRVGSLRRGESYTLRIPKGTLLGPGDVEAGEASIPIKLEEEEASDYQLVTSNPLPQARKVYAYLASVYGKKSLSGTMANVNWNIAEAELVQRATGKYPAIAFFDYIHLFASPANWIDYSDTKVVEDWWNAGGLVGAGWHWNVPNVENGTEYTCTPGNGTQNSDGNWTTAFRPKHATVEGTWENRVVKADLKKIAEYLKLLQDKNIPVIWRPLHEAAGNIYEYTGGTAWFWWGYDGADAYKKLWIYMFDFFKEQGINNLIWVWTTQTKDDEFYPGDDYVDIVGRDIYNQKSGTDNAAQYSAVAKSYSKKLVALSECGNVAPVSSQWSAGARWSFFMPWYQYNATSLDGHGHADTAWWKDAMAQDFVITRDQLPSMK